MGKTNSERQLGDSCNKEMWPECGSWLRAWGSGWSGVKEGDRVPGYGIEGEVKAQGDS